MNNLNNLNIPDDKKNALLQMAAQKLGTDPATLQQQLEAGQLGDLAQNLDPKAASKVNSMLQNPKAVEALLQNDKVRSMLGLGGK